jgi:D-alanine-D-alanine ligase
MIKSDKHIEIVRSTIKELSSMSQESCDSIIEVLTRHFTKVGVTIINKVVDLDVLIASQPDLVFLGMKFIPLHAALGIADPDKIWLSDVLDDHGIAYTGSDRISHELEFNKPAAKRRILEAGLKTPAYRVIKQNHVPDSKTIPLEFPLFVKPTNRGGGFGIDSASVVHDFTALRAKVQTTTTTLRSDVLVEEYLPGREFSVAILKSEYPSEYMVMPIELIAPLNEKGSRLLSNQVKSSNAEQAIAVTGTAVKFTVTSLAMSAFLALGARDYGRIDIRLDKTGTPYFLEANLIPSLISGYGSFPKALMLNIGLEYEPMIMRIAELALARQSSNIAYIPELLKVISPAAIPPNKVVLGPV